MTIAITSSGIALDGPLVAGEKVAVTVSGLSFTAEDKPTLALLARFPDALLSSVELAEDAQTPGTWTGELDTATKQTALFFATARADERRDAALELVAGRVSLARLTVPMANSALCPKPDGSPFASPVYVPVPGPPGQGGDPYDQAPQMDGEASAGVSDEYARGDHRHPTDTTRQEAISDLAAIRSGAAAGATAVQPAALSAYRTAAAQDVIDAGKASAADVAAIQGIIPATASSSNKLATAADIPAAQVQANWNETDTSSKAYIKNKPTIPGPAPVTSVNGDTGDVALYGNTILMEQGQSTTVSTAIANAQNDATSALNELAYTADASSLAPAFSDSSTYAVGDYVTHEGLLYKCTTAVSTAGAWEAANWTAVAVTDEMGGGGGITAVKMSNGVALTPDASGAVTLPNHKIWASSGSYGSNLLLIATPQGGDFVLKDRATIVYPCPINAFANARINVAETGYKYIHVGDGINDPKISDGMMKPGGVYLLMYKSTRDVWVLQGALNAPLASPAFTGTPTAPTAAAGTNTAQIATTAFVQDAVRYAFASPTPTVSGTSATVACEDRAINDFTVATGITSLTITPPAAVAGRARDFFCRVTLTDASLPTVTLSGATIDIGASEVAGMTQGVNLLMFTEIASGHWLASRRSAS